MTDEYAPESLAEWRRRRGTPQPAAATQGTPIGPVPQLSLADWRARRNRPNQYPEPIGPPAPKFPDEHQYAPEIVPPRPPSTAIGLPSPAGWGEDMLTEFGAPTPTPGEQVIAARQTAMNDPEARERKAALLRQRDAYMAEGPNMGLEKGLDAALGVVPETVGRYVKGAVEGVGHLGETIAEPWRRQAEIEKLPPEQQREEILKWHRELNESDPLKKVADKFLTAAGHAALAIHPVSGMAGATAQGLEEAANDPTVPEWGRTAARWQNAPMKALHEYVGKPVAELTGSEFAGLVAELGPFMALEAGGRMVINEAGLRRGIRPDMPVLEALQRAREATATPELRDVPLPQDYARISMRQPEGMPGVRAEPPVAGALPNTGFPLGQYAGGMGEIQTGGPGVLEGLHKLPPGAPLPLTPGLRAALGLPEGAPAPRALPEQAGPTNYPSVMLTPEQVAAFRAELDLIQRGGKPGGVLPESMRLPEFTGNAQRTPPNFTIVPKVEAAPPAAPVEASIEIPPQKNPKTKKPILGTPTVGTGEVPGEGVTPAGARVPPPPETPLPTEGGVPTARFGRVKGAKPTAGTVPEPPAHRFGRRPVEEAAAAAPTAEARPAAPTEPPQAAAATGHPRPWELHDRATFSARVDELIATGMERQAAFDAVVGERRAYGEKLLAEAKDGDIFVDPVDGQRLRVARQRTVRGDKASPREGAIQDIEILDANGNVVDVLKPEWQSLADRVPEGQAAAPAPTPAPEGVPPVVAPRTGVGTGEGAPTAGRVIEGRFGQKPSEGPAYEFTPEQIAKIEADAARMSAPPKEPWQTRRDEYVGPAPEFKPGSKHGLEPAKATGEGLQGYEANEAQRVQGELDASLNKWIAARKTATTEHRAAVERALAEGKEVPPEVLADYPDLKPSTELAAPAADTPSVPPGSKYVVRLDAGRGVGVDSFEEAARKTQGIEGRGFAFWEANPHLGDILDQSGKVVAHVSPNGRVWAGPRGHFDPAAEPLSEAGYNLAPKAKGGKIEGPKRYEAPRAEEGPLTPEQQTQAERYAQQLHDLFDASQAGTMSQMDYIDAKGPVIEKYANDPAMVAAVLKHLEKLDPETPAGTAEPKWQVLDLPKPTPEAAPSATPETLPEGVFYKETKHAGGQVTKELRANTADLNVEAASYQHRRDVNAKGTGERAKDVKAWKEPTDPLSVWLNPETGTVDVVNGHHRMAIAERSGQPDVPIKFIEAGSKAEARQIGFLENLKGGNIDAVDAADYFRSEKMSPAEIDAFLKDHGVSAKLPGVSEGRAVAALPDSAWDAFVREGRFNKRENQRAIETGEAIRDQGLTEDQAFQLIEETKGQPIDEIGSIARSVKLAGSESKGGVMGLWGEMVPAKSLIKQEGSLRRQMLNALAEDKRTVGSTLRNKEALEKSGVATVDEALATELHGTSKTLSDQAEAWLKSDARTPLDDFVTEAARAVDEQRMNDIEAVADLTAKTKAWLLEDPNVRQRVSKFARKGPAGPLFAEEPMAGAETIGEPAVPAAKGRFGAKKEAPAKTPDEAALDAATERMREIDPTFKAEEEPPVTERQTRQPEVTVDPDGHPMTRSESARGALGDWRRMTPDEVKALEEKYPQGWKQKQLEVEPPPAPKGKPKKRFGRRGERGMALTPFSREDFTGIPANLIDATMEAVAKIRRSDRKTSPKEFWTNSVRALADFARAEAPIERLERSRGKGIDPAGPTAAAFYGQGATGKQAEALYRHGTTDWQTTKVVEPIEAAINDAVKHGEGGKLSAYLIAKRTDTRYTPHGLDSGFDPRWASEFRRAIEADPANKRIIEAAERLNRGFQELLDELYVEGGLPKDAYDAIKRDNGEFYVPMERVLEQGGVTGGSGGGGPFAGSGLHKITAPELGPSSTRFEGVPKAGHTIKTEMPPVHDVLLRAFERMRQGFGRLNAARTARRLAEWYDADPAQSATAGMKEVQLFGKGKLTFDEFYEQQMKADPSTHPLEIMERWEDSLPANTMTAIVGGKMRAFEFADAATAEVMKKLRPSEALPLAKFLKGKTNASGKVADVIDVADKGAQILTAVRRWGISGGNAAFALVQAWMDPLNYVMTPRGSVKANLRALKNLPIGYLDSIYNGLRQATSTDGFLPNTKVAQLYERLPVEGFHDTSLSRGPHGLRPTRFGRFKEAARPTDRISNVLGGVEGGPRNAEFRNWLAEHGKNAGDPLTFDEMMQLSNAGSRVTLPFKAGSAPVKNVSRYAAYFGAGVQGLRTPIDWIRDHPKETMLKVLAISVIPRILMWARDHDEEWYKRDTLYNKYGFWRVNEDVRLPNRHLVDLPAEAVQMALDTFAEEDPEKAKALAKELLAQFAGDVGREIPMPIPDVPKAATEVLADYNFFTGRSINPKSMQGVEDRAPWLVANPEDPKIMEGVSKWLHDALGVKMTTAHLSHLARHFTGPVGIESAKVGQDTVGTPEPHTEPILGRFHPSLKSSVHLSKFWELLGGFEGSTRAASISRSRGDERAAMGFDLPRADRSRISRIQDKLKKLSDEYDVAPSVAEKKALARLMDIEAQEGVAIMERAMKESRSMEDLLNR